MLLSFNTQKQPKASGKLTQGQVLEHKKWLAITHYRIGVCKQPTLIRETH